MVHQERTGHLVNLVCLVYQALTASQEPLGPREKRVIQACWVFQEWLERRGLEESLVYQDVQERPDWLVCLGPLGRWAQRGPPDLRDQVIVLDLTTWKAQEVSPMDFLVSEDLKEDRVLLVFLDFLVNLGCLV